MTDSTAELVKEVREVVRLRDIGWGGNVTWEAYREMTRRLDGLVPVLCDSVDRLTGELAEQRDRAEALLADMMQGRAERDRLREMLERVREVIAQRTNAVAWTADIGAIDIALKREKPSVIAGERQGGSDEK